MKPNIKTSGWQTAVKNTYIPHDLESYPFYFKINSLMGSEDWIEIRLYSASRTEDYIFTTVWLYLSHPPDIWVEYCSTGWKLLNTSLK